MVWLTKLNSVDALASFSILAHHEFNVCFRYLSNICTHNKSPRECETLFRSRQALHQSGWLSVRQLAAYHTLTMMYKVLKTGAPSYLYMKLCSSFPYKTRFSVNQNIRMGPEFHAQNSLSQRSFRWRGSQLWNSLPAGLKTVGKLSNFKWKTRKWVLDNIDF